MSLPPEAPSYLPPHLSLLGCHRAPDLCSWHHIANSHWLSTYFMGFPGDKEPTCQFRRHKRHGFDPWVRKIPWRRAWWSTSVFLSGESHGQRSLVCYSPWGHKSVRHDWTITLSLFFTFHHDSYAWFYFCCIGVLFNVHFYFFLSVIFWLIDITAFHLLIWSPINEFSPFSAFGIKYLLSYYTV